jgi:hypothetical protein
LLLIFQNHSGHDPLDEPLGHQWEFRLTMLVLIPILFGVGMAFMALYYLTQHPDGKMPDRSQKASLF